MTSKVEVSLDITPFLKLQMLVASTFQDKDAKHSFNFMYVRALLKNLYNEVMMSRRLVQVCASKYQFLWSDIFR